MSRKRMKDVDLKCPCGDVEMFIQYSADVESPPLFCPFCGVMLETDDLDEDTEETED